MDIKILLYDDSKWILKNNAPHILKGKFIIYSGPCDLRPRPSF